jgi:NAD dependent epimerase/dehydratase family enzyme
VLASQRVTPVKLTENGFNFENPDAPSIAAQVVRLLTN